MKNQHILSAACSRPPTGTHGKKPVFIFFEPLASASKTTIVIPFNVDEFLLKQALEALGAIGEINVERHNNNNRYKGYNYFVTCDLTFRFG